jgi:hypothetical protein
VKKFPTKSLAMKPHSIIISLSFLFTPLLIAEEFGGIEFPQGSTSFADRVVSYEPDFSGGAVPTENTDAQDALGVPDFPDASDNKDDVSLGSGGRITLEFTNNVLTGSGDPSPDLHIFEVGSQVEDTFVEISKDGSTWHAVGKVFGGVSSVDIDAFGFDQTDEFRFIRLTDDQNEGGTSGATVGADIDAVGAIASNRVPHTPDDLSLGRAVAVKWTSLLGSLYKIEESTDMESWTIARDQIVGTGGEIKEYFDAEVPRKFYRVAPVE